MVSKSSSPSASDTVQDAEFGLSGLVANPSAVTKLLIDPATLNAEAIVPEVVFLFTLGYAPSYTFRSLAVQDLLPQNEYLADLYQAIDEVKRKSESEVRTWKIDLAMLFGRSIELDIWNQDSLTYIGDMSATSIGSVCAALMSRHPAARNIILTFRLQMAASQHAAEALGVVSGHSTKNKVLGRSDVQIGDLAPSEADILLRFIQDRLLLGHNLMQLAEAYHASAAPDKASRQDGSRIGGGAPSALTLEIHPRIDPVDLSEPIRSKL